MEVNGAPPAKEEENAFWDVNKIYRAFWYGTDEEGPIWLLLVMIAAIAAILIWFFVWADKGDIVF